MYSVLVVVLQIGATDFTVSTVRVGRAAAVAVCASAPRRGLLVSEHQGVITLGHRDRLRAGCI